MHMNEMSELTNPEYNTKVIQNLQIKNCPQKQNVLINTNNN